MNTERQQPGPLPEPDVTTLCDYFDAAGKRHRLAYSVDVVRELLAAERERCAELCEAEYVLDRLDSEDGHPCDLAYNRALQDAAAAIRKA